MERVLPGLTTIILLLGIGIILPAGTSARADADRKDHRRLHLARAVDEVRENRDTGHLMIKRLLDDLEKTDGVLGGIRVVAHKGGSGMIAEVPDVCLTPPGTPLSEVPYPNIGKSSDTAKGSRKIRVGSRPIAVGGTGHATKIATDDVAASGAVLDRLRTIRRQLDTRHEFLSDLCKGCELRRDDRKKLRHWLSATRKEALDLRTRLDDLVSHVEQVR